MGEFIRLTKEQQKARKLRSAAIGLGLMAFVVVVYIVTYFRASQEAGIGGF